MVPGSELAPAESPLPSRGIGATHIVSGSCRLSRTLMMLGEAVGKAAAIAAARNLRSDEINPVEIADFDL